MVWERLAVPEVYNPIGQQPAVPTMEAPVPTYASEPSYGTFKYPVLAFEEEAIPVADPDHDAKITMIADRLEYLKFTDLEVGSLEKVVYHGDPAYFNGSDKTWRELVDYAFTSMVG